MSTVLHICNLSEPLLLAFALCALLRSKERNRFPALMAYFALRVTSYLLLVGILHIRSVLNVSSATAYEWYFVSYWATYLIGAIAVFFVIQELFKYALEPLPGLKRLGSIAFRWVACVSLVAALAAILTPRTAGYQILIGAADQLMRCESIFVLCLLLFLVVTAGKLGLSYRNRVFGVSFGFGIIAASNLISSAMMFNFGRSMINSTVTTMETAGSVLTLIIWSAYFVKKEPIRGAATLPMNSPLVRWNEIAMALGSPTNRVTAMPPPATDFFLQDVEKVVDRILTKNSLSAAS